MCRSGTPISEPHENTIVIASLSRSRSTRRAWPAGSPTPAVAADLAEVGITSTTQLLDFFLLGDRAVRSFPGPEAQHRRPPPRSSSSLREACAESNPGSIISPRSGWRGSRSTPTWATLSAAQRARLARWYAGTTYKLAGQSSELEGRFAEALEAYTEGVRLNPEDLLAQVRLERLRGSSRRLAQTA